MAYIVTHTSATLENYEIEDWYRDDLDEVFGDIDVCGCSYPAGRILQEIDPIAFRQGMLDWIDNKCQSGEWTEV